MAATISGSGTSTLIDLTTSGNTILGDASTDTLNVGNGGLVKDASGNVGIGTSSPVGKLTVSKAGAEGIEFIPGGTSNVSTTQYYNRSGAVYTANAQDASYHSWLISGAEKARIDSSGNLLVGTTSGSGARMDVVAADEVVSFNRSAATDGVVQRWRKAGSTVGYVSTNTYSLPSDERVKTNIVNIGYGLDFVNSLRPVQYNTIFQDPENETKKNFGLIAQEVEQALANIGKSVDDVTFLEKFVPENDTESRYGLGYQNLVPVLIKAIQEQQAIITQLQADVEALKAQP